MLAQLLEIELEYQRAAGEIPTRESLESRFPENESVVRRVYEAKSGVGFQPADHRFTGDLNPASESRGATASFRCWAKAAWEKSIEPTI